MNRDPVLRGWRAFVAARFKWLAPACALVLLTPWLATLLSRTGWNTAYWLADLAAHWQWLALALGLVTSTTLAILTRRKLWLAAWLVCPLPWLSASVPAPAASATSTGKRLSMVTANVHYSTRDVAPLRDFALAPDPADLVVVIELGVDYARQLATWKEWPHQIRMPRSDPFGLALLSRHPIIGAEQLESASGIPRLRVRLDWQGEDVEVVLAHPMPPLNAGFARERDATLAEEAERLARTGKPGLVAGDFNATPWSSAFAGPAAQGVLRASPLFPGTWPAPGSVFGIPIDHVLVTRHWLVSEQAVGPNIGSDHLPVRVTLRRAPAHRP